MNNKEQLCLKLHQMIIERLEEIGKIDYDWDLSELDDPVINNILEMRKLIFMNN